MPGTGHARSAVARTTVRAVQRAGVLRAVEGRDSVAAVPEITGLTITTPVGQPVRPRVTP